MIDVPHRREYKVAWEMGGRSAPRDPKNAERAERA